MLGKVVPQLDPGRLRWLLAGDLHPLFAKETVATTWQWWRHGPPTDRGYLLGTTDDAAHITDATQLPTTLAEFEQLLKTTFQHAGFDADAAGWPAAPARPKGGFWKS